MCVHATLSLAFYRLHTHLLPPLPNPHQRTKGSNMQGLAGLLRMKDAEAMEKVCVECHAARPNQLYSPVRLHAETHP